MIKRPFLLATAAAVMLSGVALAAGTSHYAGLEEREIKALSSAELEGLLNGAGMGMALPAELNGFPGPMHVLELADELDLTPEQRDAARRAFDTVKASARDLGARVVDAERSLDRLFADGDVDAASLKQATARIASLRGELRAAHLAAHLEMKSLLNVDQIAAYTRARGYAASMDHHGHGHGHGHAD